LQITNFIQDIKIDLEKNRIYIPEDLLKKHKVNISNSIDQRITDDNDIKKQFENLIIELVDINKNLYIEGQKLTSHLSRKDSIIIQIFISSGEIILNKIKKNKSEILQKKPKTNSFEKFIIIIKSILKSLFKN